MACIRKRRGKYVVDYRDGAGVRRWVTCETRREAETVLREALFESRQRMRPVVDPDITLAGYAPRWLSLIAASVKPRSLEIYRHNVAHHILPVLGTRKIRDLQKGHVKAFLADKGVKFARRTVQVLYATLRGMLNAAVEDGVILANPAAKLGRQLRLASVPRQEEIKAFTQEQLARFLTVAASVAPRFFPLFLLFARTGLRVGEGLALQWEDLDYQAREIRVTRAFSAGRLQTPKGHMSRTVDMSGALRRVLLRLQVDRKAETLRRGWPTMPPWVFCSPTGRPLRGEDVAKGFKRVLKAAGLPLHFTPHCLRHSYASLLLQMGVSPAYVQRQLGHHSIKLTVDVYGRWLPMGNPAIVDRLDGASGSKMVAAGGGPEGRGPGIIDLSDTSREGGRAAHATSS